MTWQPARGRTGRIACSARLVQSSFSQFLLLLRRLTSASRVVSAGAKNLPEAKRVTAEEAP